MNRTSANNGEDNSVDHNMKPSGIGTASRASTVNAAGIENRQVQSISQKHTFLANLVGLDQVQEEARKRNEHPKHASHAAIWASALQEVRLGQILQGIEFSANFWFAVLFVCFFAWLYVVYWVRHHEPMANQVIGTTSMNSTTATADRQIVAGAKDAFPMKTSSQMGNFYVPVPGSETDSAGLAYAGVVKNSQSTLHAAPIASPHTDSEGWAPPPVAPMSGNGPMSSLPFNSASPVLDPSMVGPQAGNAFNVPVQSPAGTRVKTIVNR